MFGFLGKNEKRMFDRKVLRKNDISLLILDERWNALFSNHEKDEEILKSEQNLRKLLKEQSKLLTESKKLAQRKKILMNTIIKLTSAAFEENDHDAREEMDKCQKEIKEINKRLSETEKELEEMPDRLKEANLDLLENTVNLVYFNMRSCQKRKEELDRLIEDEKAKLKNYIDERETLAEDYTGTYSYFHDLLGGEELERLDKRFFNGKQV